MDEPTIDQVLTELHALGYRGTAAYSHGADHDTGRNWKVVTYGRLGDDRQPEGDGDTPTEAYRACLADARAMLTPAGRLAPEEW